MPKRGTIVFVAVLLNTDDKATIADALNETLRPARLDPKNSAIMDYAFNLGKDRDRGVENCEKLPLPQPYKIHKSYEEDDFINDMDDNRVMDRDCGLPVLDAIGEVVAGRDEMTLEEFYKKIGDDGQEIYEGYVGPAIDELVHHLTEEREDDNG